MATFYYMIGLSGYDSFARLRGAFCAGRRQFWQTGKPVRLRGEEVLAGTPVRYRGRWGRSRLDWKVWGEGRVLEQAFSTREGYSVLTWDISGRLVSKANFLKGHFWRQTAYYRGAEGPEEPPVSVLRPQQDGSVLQMDFDPAAKKYYTRRLVRCPAAFGTASNSALNDLYGEPAVFAATPEGGCYFCTEEESARRQAAAPPEENELERIWTPAAGEPAPAEAEPEPPEDLADLPVDLADLAALDGVDLEEEIEGSPGETEEPEAPQWDPAAAVERLLPARQAEPAAAAQETPPVAGNPEPETAQPYAVDHEVRRAAPTTRRMVAAQGMGKRLVHEGALLENKTGQEHSADEAAGFFPATSIVISAAESYLFFGEWMSGLRSGRGRTSLPNGWTAYEGVSTAAGEEFGVYYYRQGKLCYAGNWKRGGRDGIGIAFPPEGGGMYVGRWEGGEPVGMPAAPGENPAQDPRVGAVFVGNWPGGEPTGEGSEFGPDGRLRYTGGWKDGKRDGFGTEYEENGAAAFVGMWKAGERGEGIRYRDGVPEQPAAPVPQDGENTGKQEE